MSHAWDTWDIAVLGSEFIGEMKKLLQEAENDNVVQVLETSLFGITLHVEENPETRRSLAIAMSAATGKPTAFEDEEGNLKVVEMPMPNSIFPGYIRKIARFQPGSENA